MAAQPNSLAAITARSVSGRVSRTGPLLLLFTRSIMWMTAQGLVALLFVLQHRHHHCPHRVSPRTPGMFSLEMRCTGASPRLNTGYFRLLHLEQTLTVPNQMGKKRPRLWSFHLLIYLRFPSHDVAASFASRTAKTSRTCYA